MKKLVLILTLVLCGGAYSFGQGTTCLLSTLLVQNGACGSGTISDATLEAGVNSTNVCGSGQNIQREGWFSFVATSTAVTISANASNRNLTLQVFSGTCLGLTEIGCSNATTTNGAQTEVVNLTGLTIGLTYFVRIGNITANNMNLNTLCITSAAPPANDNPCSAIAISGGGACSYYNGTNAFATASVGVPAPGCAGYSGGDVWFTATVPASGNITFDTQTGTMLDGGMAIYSGTCGALTLLACDNDNSANGAMPMIALSGQTPGATLYIRIWENGNDNNGTFGVCAYDPTTPATNCTGAIGVCNDASFAGNSSGFGTQELNASNQGCLSTFEHQTTWFAFSPALTGTIQLTINPVAGAVDYDFAIWGPYPPGTGCPVTSTPLRCSYSSATTPTGLLTGAGDNTEGAGGDAWVNSIVVTAGDIGMIYYLVVDNFTANTTAFTLDWGLSPNNMLDCTPPLPVELAIFNAEPEGEWNKVYWNTLTETNCSHFIIDRSSDGINYEYLGRRDGHGNTNNPQSYYLYDPKPAAVTYYKIRQVDFNGHETSYGPVVVVNSDVSKFSVQSVYPNPAEESFFIDVYSKDALPAEIVIFNSVGQMVYNKTSEIEGTVKLEIPSSTWMPGIYTVKITNEKHQFQQIEKVIIK